MVQRIFNATAFTLVSLAMVACGSEKPLSDSGEKESYIVVYEESQVQGLRAASQGQLSAQEVVQSVAKSIDQEYRVSAQKVFSAAIPAGVYELSKEEAERMALDPRVAFVEKDQIVSINAEQSKPPWGLDRIDQQSRSLDGIYRYETGGAQVNAYVIDTGIRITHKDFNGRAYHGIDTIDNDRDSSDCNGHGTHVAGTIGGDKYGVAKSVRLYGVRVLSCNGSGQYSAVIEGIEWVTKNHRKPAVANMSLGGSISQAIDLAVRNSVAAGVTYVVAAGNSSANACGSSPSRVAEAITVGSVTKSDRRSSFSNYGSCVDIYAPGSDIASAWPTSDYASRTISGTSMASPHVAGVAALYLAKVPQASPSQVGQALVSGALAGILADVRSGSPNLLLNTEFLSEGEGLPPEEEEEGENEDGVLVPGQTVSSLSGKSLDEIHYEVHIPSGVSRLRVIMSGGTGDADLYARVGGKPTLTAYNCRPYRYGNAEECVWHSPTSDKLYIMVQGYKAFTGVRLSIVGE